MKKILFLIVALASMLTCLFYAFDISLFQNNEFEKKEIEEPKYQLIYDADYDFYTEPLYLYSTARHKNREKRQFFESRRLRKGIINDTLQLDMAEIGAYEGVMTNISIYKDSIRISDAVHYSCTFDVDYELIYGKVVLNQKPKLYSDLYTYFDILFISKKKNDNGNKDSLFIKGSIKLEILDTLLYSRLFTKNIEENERKTKKKYFFEMTDSQANKIEVLDFSGVKTNNLPKNINKFTSLKVLDLRGNNLSVLELAKIAQLHQLEKLYLNGNNLKEIPKYILELKKLKVLDISDNEIKNLPKNFDKLENLEALYIEGNKFEHFPLELKKMSNLKEVFIRGNDINLEELKNIQKSFTQLKIFDFGF